MFIVTIIMLKNFNIGVKRIIESKRANRFKEFSINILRNNFNIWLIF